MTAPSSSESDSIAVAESVAKAHFNVQIVSCRLHDEQGAYSKTFVVELEDQSKAVVQFRESPLNLSLYELAYQKLGNLVPKIEEKKSADISLHQHVYIMNYIDGEMWNSALGAWPGAWEDDAAVAGQLGEALSRCIVGPDSSEAVESYIIPRLQTVLNENIPSDRPELRKSVEELLESAHNLNKLPLSLSHVDLNATNMLIAKRGPPQLIGILDWDLSRYLPFGIDAAQIRYMAVINRDRVDYPTEPSSTMVATSFWKALTANLDFDLREYVVDAMKVGVIIYLEFPEGCGEREKREIQNAEKRLQWFDDVFRPLCSLR
ncbi:hypothetical protein D9757_011994 [Collybiopsis confluens]|uniref:Aminoglycoside phosphotransferase domain-containing protein n=1 Tax=Collybiopsis confluens TaxID=2823264 RepID=A0A8H5LTR9_9AGAR|nr:hypothetical protein D9757_011994 [Collybiopsis confluens]